MTGFGIPWTQRMLWHFDPQDILETWRLRTPNEWEPLTVWSDVLNWRNAIYNVVFNACKHMGDIAPHLHQLGYKDKAWCDGTGLPVLHLMEASPCIIACPYQLHWLPPAGLRGQSLVYDNLCCI